MPPGCKSDPSEGCDNSQLVTAIEECCASQGEKLDGINTKLTEIKEANAACCTLITDKQDEMIALLTTISEK